MSQTFNQYPSAPASDLSLRALYHNLGNHVQVKVLRVRARLSAFTTGELPDWTFDVPDLQDKALVGAYAHPFVAKELSTEDADPTAGDTGVVRPIVQVKGARSLRLQLLSNDASAGWPGDADGTVQAAPPEVFQAARAHEVLGIVDDRPGSPSSIVRPYEIVFVKDRGTDPDDTSHNLYTCQLSNGAAVRVSRDSSQAPAVGDYLPADAEDSIHNYSVGSAGLQQSRSFPLRNAYPVPTIGDQADVLTGPNEQHVFPDTVKAVRIVYDFPENPSTQVKKITLESGATIKASITADAVVGERYSDENPTAYEAEADVLDPTEWWEFDVWLITADQAFLADNGAVVTDLSLGGAGRDIEDASNQIGLGYHADVWAYFPGLIDETS